MIRRSPCESPKKTASREPASRNTSGGWQRQERCLRCRCLGDHLDGGRREGSELRMKIVCSWQHARLCYCTLCCGASMYRHYPCNFSLHDSSSCIFDSMIIWWKHHIWNAAILWNSAVVVAFFYDLINLRATAVLIVGVILFGALVRIFPNVTKCIK